MSNFSPDFFDSIYASTPPWEIDGPQPAISALLDEHPPTAPVLDAGCGSGDHAIAIARRGLRVLGIDVVEAAIAQARDKARALPPDAGDLLEFQVADALRPTLLERRFGAVVDSGFFHLFEQDQRDRLAEEFAAVLIPGGRLYLLEFAVEFPLPTTPRKVTDDELRARFSTERGWRILALRPAQFQSRIAPVPAVAACIERLPADHA
ncbi:class I SAM-dependent methyltransferase [Longimicrobium terrae]|uniref:SAM-dependent methyltransferase n=1 Tax=Longimicrobium terrae TaxID=1639882 RepID=A0A841GPP8_9BACT|nr:class I SAM-dependent methyltransferase [Longimicrobium terrae]MBB4634160.1 SAM-dependent methyltransferase [Longimicrobium terrae]MBB6068950.1 SAM-dependent methyltransferase [Longimicrobium terrae]NNC28129.1 class I SAM-dependent methyltransferase [Longimicrobium terrae]